MDIIRPCFGIGRDIDRGTDLLLIPYRKVHGIRYTGIQKVIDRTGAAVFGDIGRPVLIQGLIAGKIRINGQDLRILRDRDLSIFIRCQTNMSQDRSILVRFQHIKDGIIERYTV